MIWFLFFLAGAVAIGYFVWNYQRKAEAREAASKKRFEEMFMARASAAAPAAPVAAPATTAAPLPEAKAVPLPAATAQAQRFLGPAETLVYRLLRASIPDHEVFANVTLASVLGPTIGGVEREQQLRRLSQYRLDFVVCDKSMHVVSVVEVEHAAGAQTAGDRQFRADSLKAAGIGLVRINATALPRREELRAMICGAAAPGGPAAGGRGKNG